MRDSEPAIPSPRRGSLTPCVQGLRQGLGALLGLRVKEKGFRFA